MNARFLTLFALALLALAACSDDEETSSTVGPPDVEPGEFAKVPKSCAYDCPAGACAEAETGYQCQNLEPWKLVPHAETCEAWDGKYPAVSPGKCTASEPTGDAKKYAGKDPDDPQRIILPDGRRITPAGGEWAFDDTDVGGGITTGIVAIPNSSLVATVDNGPGLDVVRLVDTALVGSSDPVKARVVFEKGVYLNSLMAFAPPDLVLVPSANGKVFALKVDVAAATLVRDDARWISLPPPADPESQPDGWYASSVAVSADGKRLAVAPVVEKQLLVYDVEAGSAGYGKLLGQAELGAKEAFGVYFDPSDATGVRAYVTLWADSKLVEIDLTNAAAPVVSRSFATAKDPQGVAFLDSRWMVVGGDLGDALNVIDRTSGTVTELPVDESEDLYGLEPSALAFDAPAKRLYAVLSGINAVAAYDVDLASEPPKITPAGRLPTGWWPSGVVVGAGGSLDIVTMRGRGTGPNPEQFDIGDGGITDQIRGGIQHVPAPSAAALSTGATQVEANNAVRLLSGHPTVSCADGAADFPLPETNDQPSPHIQHVFFIVRENKNFDAVLGDLPGVEGDAKLTMKTSPDDMERIWGNFRTLAREFAHSDNYYIAAVESVQGHVWTTYGRTHDFNERTWAVSGGPPRLIPAGGITEVGRPVEGSVFDWAGKNGLTYDILGEIVGSPKIPVPFLPVDAKYPGGPFQSLGYNDDEKACHLAGRARVLCDLGQFVYITLPNDHTSGVSPNIPTPELYCAVNDEATGMVVDAISHSPLWKSSLIIVTEDDPQQGGEHIDGHRTPLVLISPWVKRGYVSKSHIDTASVHKIFAHVFGKPYPNYQVKNAMLPLDAFSSTPDYTPYTYKPRTWPLECGDKATAAEKLITEAWDFSEVDEQPGLGSQVARWMRGKQITELSAEQELELRARASAIQRARAAASD